MQVINIDNVHRGPVRPPVKPPKKVVSIEESRRYAALQRIRLTAMSRPTDPSAA